MSLLPALLPEPGAGQRNGRRCWALGSQHGGAAAVTANSGGAGRAGAGARQPGKPCARASSAGSVLHVHSLDLHDSLDLHEGVLHFKVLSFASCACRAFTSA